MSQRVWSAGAGQVSLPSKRVRNRWLTKTALYLLTVWAVLTLNFALPRFMPGDPILAMSDADSEAYVYDPALRTRLEAYYGLDRPLPEQYLAYLKNIGAGDLGWSIRWNTPVAGLVASHLPWTLLLVIPSLLVSSFVTVLAGVHSAWWKDTLIDRLLIFSFTLLRTLPIFFVGIIILLVFSVRLGWFPLGGSATPFRTWPSVWHQAYDIFRHWTLPFAVLTLEMIGGRYLLMRNSMVTILGERFMLVGRAKGLEEHTLKYRYGMRNAVLPFLTAFSAQLAFAVAGVIFIETLFAYPGMGRLMFDAVNARDYPVLEGAFLVTAFSVLAINFLTESLYTRLDPRVAEV